MKRTSAFLPSIGLLLLAFGAGSAKAENLTVHTAPPKVTVPTMSTKTGGGIKSSEVRGFSFQTTAPRDVSTGLATGKRQHQPFSITNQTDVASPKLFSR